MSTKISRILFSSMALFCLLAFPVRGAGLAASQTQTGPVATLTVTKAGLVWQPLVEASGWTLRVALPGGQVLEKSFAGGDQPALKLTNDQGQVLPDGIYTYELWWRPAGLPVGGQTGSAENPGAALAVEGQSSAVPLAISGTFAILNGAAILPDTSAAGAPPPDQPAPPNSPEDDIIADDLIVQGRACIGTGGCTDGMTFNSEPLVLRQNVLRVMLDDTSPFMGAEPYRDWVFLVNDGAAGGAEYFAIQDFGVPSSVPFKIMGGAPTNSIYLANDGDVGLGTSVPEANLHITSAALPPHIRLEQVSTAQEWSISADSAGFYIWDATHTLTPFIIEASSPYGSLYVKSNGNVGLGTNMPATKLHVTGGNLRVDNTTMPSLLLYQAGGADPAQMWSINANHNSLVFNDGSHGNVRPFIVETAAPTNSLYVDSTGRVGIGTDSPGATLHVNGSMRAAGMIVESGSPVNSLFVDSTGRVGVGTNTPGATLHVNGSMRAAGMIVESGSPVNSLFVDSTGRVGVGTNTPATTLHVNGSLRAAGMIVESGSPVNTLYVDSTGNVGVGTNAPAAKLHVDGDLQLEGFINERSDQAAKTAFAAVDGQRVLERLASIPITTWVYKDSPEVRHMGPMAQDFRSAFGLGTDEKHLAALDANGVALAAIQALDAQVQEQALEISEKDARIQELQRRVQALERRATTHPICSLWNGLAPLALGLLGVFMGLRLARRQSQG